MNNSIKILLANSKLYTDDTWWPQKVFHDLILFLEKKSEVELYILTEKWSSKYKDTYSSKINFLFLEKPKWVFSFFRYQLGFYKLISGFWNGFFDISHFQNFPWGKFLLSFIALKQKSKRTILTVHDWVLLELQYYKLSWKIAHIIHWYLSALVITHFDKYIVFSNFIYAKLENYLWSSEKVEKLYIWLDDSVFNVSKNELSQEKYILGYWWLNKKKWYEYLIKAYKQIENQIPHNLLIWGSWPEEESLKKLVKGLWIEHKVSFLWFLQWESKNNYITNADLIVHPAEYEGYGIAILESLILWNKVLVWDIWWQVEFTNDFNNLYLFKTKDINSLSSNILQSLQNNFEKENNDSPDQDLSLHEKYRNIHVWPLYLTLYKKLWESS